MLICWNQNTRLVFIFCHHYTCGLSWFIARHDVKVLRSCTGMKTAASQLRACSHKEMMQSAFQSPLGLDIVAGVYPGFCLIAIGRLSMFLFKNHQLRTQLGKGVPQHSQIQKNPPNNPIPIHNQQKNQWKAKSVSSVKSVFKFLSIAAGRWTPLQTDIFIPCCPDVFIDNFPSRAYINIMWTPHHFLYFCQIKEKTRLFSHFLLKTFGLYRKKPYLCIRFWERTLLQNSY